MPAEDGAVENMHVHKDTWTRMEREIHGSMASSEEGRTEEAVAGADRAAMRSAPCLGMGRIRDYSETMHDYSPSHNRTSPLMTKFEKAKILGMRTEQLARGATPMIVVPVGGGDDGGAYMSPSDIAYEELRVKATPYVVVRDLPDGTRENWKIADMIVIL